MSINVFVGSGNLARDPEPFRTKSGLAGLDIALAQDVKARNPETGEAERTAQFIDCVIFGPYAETMASYLVKGMAVTIQGSLRQRLWTDSVGNRRVRHVVVVSEVQLPPRGRPADPASNGISDTVQEHIKPRQPEPEH